MHEIAPGVFQIPLAPRHALNAYLLGDVLVDSGINLSVKKLVKALAGRPVVAHAATHAHPDHVGGTKGIAAALGIPVWIGAGDAPALAAGRTVGPPGRLGPVLERLGGFGAYTADRQLAEGDELSDSGFVVLDTPGHSAGHQSYWRESDRVLIAGDAIFGMNVITFQQGIREPLGLPTVDPVLARASLRRLAALEPAVTVFGHGAPWRDTAALTQFAAALPV